MNESFRQNFMFAKSQVKEVFKNLKIKLSYVAYQIGSDGSMIEKQNG